MAFYQSDETGGWVKLPLTDTSRQDRSSKVPGPGSSLPGRFRLRDIPDRRPTCPTHPLKSGAPHIKLTAPLRKHAVSREVEPLLLGARRCPSDTNSSLFLARKGRKGMPTGAHCSNLY